MNLFQQILSVSKEFRDHFEKENQQEQRLKAVEETLASGGGGGASGSTAYQPYKKQTALFYVNYENYYNPCSINKKIGDNILSAQKKVNKMCSIAIPKENFDNGDILKSKLTFIYPKGYHAPEVHVRCTNTDKNIPQHLVDIDIAEIYEGISSLKKDSQSAPTFDIASINEYNTSTEVHQTAFYVFAEVELHKSN